MKNVISRVFLITCICIAVCCGCNAESQIVSKDTILMGSAFIFTAVDQDKNKATEAVNKAILKVWDIEQKISSWLPTSQTTLINNNAGIKAVKVDEDLFRLIVRSKKVSDLSNGYFDISFASINKYWSFEGQNIDLLDSIEIKKSVALIDYNNIIVDAENQTVFLKNKGMKIGFGGIGKGYAANEAKKVMVEAGIENGIVNAGGDLIAWGKKSNIEPWSVGIADPENPLDIVSWLDISNLSVVTSGNYQKYIIINGVRHGHIIDPKTGFPSKGVKSVTILTADPEIADALATTVYVMGEKNGLELVNKLRGVECIIINDENTFLYSENIKVHFTENE